MNVINVKTSVKIVGSNGQISLGKEFAGRQVMVEEREPGVWVVRAAVVIPENELWLHEPQAKQDLQRAIVLAEKNEPRESDLDAILGKVEHGEKRKRRPTGHQ